MVVKVASEFFSMIFSSFYDFFNILDSIVLVDGSNVSVLDFLISCACISVMLPILLTIGNARFDSSYREMRSDNKYAQRQASRKGGADNG